MWVEKSNLYFTEDQRPDFENIINGFGDPDRLDNDPLGIFDTIAKKFGEFFKDLFSEPKNNTEANKKEDKLLGIEKVSADVQNLADAQAKVIGMIPYYGVFLNGLIDYKFGKFDQDKFLTEAGTEILFGKAGGLLFTTVGAKTGNAVIKGFTQHAAAESAITRGFKTADILKIAREGTQEVIRNGTQIRYTLQGNSIVVQQTGRNAGKVVTVFSNAPGTAKGLGKGAFIPWK